MQTRQPKEPATGAGRRRVAGALGPEQGGSKRGKWACGLGLAGPRPGREQSRPAPPTWNWGVAQARGAGIRAAPLRDNSSLPRRRTRGTKARRGAGRPSAKSGGGGRGDRGGRLGLRPGPLEGVQSSRPVASPQSSGLSRHKEARNPAPRQPRGSRRRRREPLGSSHSPTARCPSSWRNLRRLAPAGCSRCPLAPTFPSQDRAGKCLPRKLPPPPGSPVSERDTTEASCRRVPASRQRGGRGPGPRGGGTAGRGRAAVHPGIGAGPHSRARGLAGSPRSCSSRTPPTLGGVRSGRGAQGKPHSDSHSKMESEGGRPLPLPCSETPQRRPHTSAVPCRPLTKKISPDV